MTWEVGLVIRRDCVVQSPFELSESLVTQSWVRPLAVIYCIPSASLQNTRYDSYLIVSELSSDSVWRCETCAFFEHRFASVALHRFFFVSVLRFASWYRCVCVRSFRSGAHVTIHSHPWNCNGHTWSWANHFHRWIYSPQPLWAPFSIFQYLCHRCSRQCIFSALSFHLNRVHILILSSFRRRSYFAVGIGFFLTFYVTEP